MLRRYRLLALLFGDLVGFGGDERYELDGTVDEEVAGIFAEGEACFVAEDFGDDLLDRGCGAGEFVLVCFEGSRQRNSVNKHARKLGGPFSRKR